MLFTLIVKWVILVFASWLLYLLIGILLTPLMMPIYLVLGERWNKPIMAMAGFFWGFPVPVIYATLLGAAISDQSWIFGILGFFITFITLFAIAGSVYRNTQANN